MSTPATGTVIDAAAGEATPGKLLPFKAARNVDDDEVLDVRMDKVYPGWEQYFLIVTDAHWDNPHCRLDLFHRFHRQAVERGAGIIYPGDFFCAMQGKFDKRADKSALRHEHQQGNYLDALVDTAAKDLEPYKANILLLAPGNHETKILRDHETDLTTRLAEKLGVYRGGYGGYIRFMFSRGNSNRITLPLWYFHGAGAGGMMTQGIPDSIRQSVWVPDAKFMVRGHSHNEWVITIPQSRIGNNGKRYLDDQVHIMGTTLKDEFNMQGGWHLETGKPPKPIGSTWLHFYYDSHARGNVGYQVLRAR